MADRLMLIDGFCPEMNELGLVMLCRPCRMRRVLPPRRGKAQQPHVFMAETWVCSSGITREKDNFNLA